MSFVYLPEVAADCSRRSGCSDGRPSATSSTPPTLSKSSRHESGTATSTTRPSGTTLEHSTGVPGVDAWILSRLAFRAHPSQLRVRDWPEKIRETCGPIQLGLSGSATRPSSFWKTFPVLSRRAISSQSLTTSLRLVTQWPRRSPWGLITLVPDISENEYGYLPTPTTQDAHNNGGPSQMRRNTIPLNALVMNLPTWIPCPYCQDFWCTIHQAHAHDCECPDLQTWDEGGMNPYDQRLPTMKPNPEFWEWLMAWPLEWTDLNPLATVRFHSWLRQHGASLPESTNDPNNATAKED